MKMKLVIGNGNILVYIDKFSQIRDFYFPFVGQENHLGDYVRKQKKPSDSHMHRIGIWCEGKIHWLGDEWETETNYKTGTLTGKTALRNNSLGLELSIIDTVHYKENIYMKKIAVKNLRKERRDIRLFMGQYFSIYGTDIGNTAYFYPQKNAIIYYKNNRYFLVSGLKLFEDFAIGNYNHEDMKGTWVDAEDGILSKNAIEHGSVDSTISFHLDLKGGSEDSVCYWIAAGKNLNEVMDLNEYIMYNSPNNLFRETENYWKNWLSRIELDIDADIMDMVKKSLLIIRAHADNRGGILASTDSETLKFDRDSYNYIWQRDAAFASIALTEAGYPELSRNFFQFCSKTITEKGYFLQKYNPNYSVGSSWHPWIKYGEHRLPIQEDETAIVLHALWKYYERTKDIKFIKGIYKDLIKKAADFLVEFREGGAPKESYDLWEERFGLHTYTACTVYAGLVAAARFSKELHRLYDSRKYLKASGEVKNYIKSCLYDENKGMFFRRVEKRVDKLYKESEIDSSTGYALHEFVFKPDEGVVKKEMDAIEKKLTCKTETGGVARYRGDQYYAGSKDVPGNPWFICTLWLAQYKIKAAKKSSELESAKSILEWAVKHASPTGFLSEQLHPTTGEQLSVSPLTWSHAAFVETVFRYVAKREEMRNQ